MKLGTLLSVAAVAIGSSILFGKSKIADFKRLGDNLKVQVKSIRSLSIKSGQLAFKIDIQLTNPTDVGFDIPGKLLEINRLRFFTPSGKSLGTVETNISDFELPANGYRIITDIPVNLSLSTIGNNFEEILAIANDSAQLRTSVDLTVLGKTYTINA